MLLLFYEIHKTEKKLVAPSVDTYLGSLFEYLKNSRWKKLETNTYNTLYIKIVKNEQT